MRWRPLIELVSEFASNCRVPESQRNSTDALGFFSETNMTRYNLQRRLVGPMLSVAGLALHEPNLDTTISEFVAKTKSLKGQAVKLDQWIYCFVVDALCQLILSETRGFVAQADDEGTLAASERVWKMFSVVGQFNWAIRFLKFLERRLPPEYDHVGATGLTTTTVRHTHDSLLLH